MAIALALYFVTDGKLLFLPLAFIPALMLGGGRGSSEMKKTNPPKQGRLSPDGIGGPPPIPSPPKQGDPRWN